MLKDITIEIRYNPALSKNMAYKPGRSGLYMTSAARAERDAIWLLIAGERRGVQWERKETWLEIIIYRPHMLGDPINFIDLVADGVKYGIDIDDRYFHASAIWELSKDEKIVIRVWQKD